MSFFTSVIRHLLLPLGIKSPALSSSSSSPTTETFRGSCDECCDFDCSHMIFAFISICDFLFSFSITPPQSLDFFFLTSTAYITLSEFTILIHADKSRVFLEPISFFFRLTSVPKNMLPRGESSQKIILV